jgi:hypothetical protein
MTKTTLYLQPELRKALKLRAVETDQSLSAVVNSMLAGVLAEDLEDMRIFDERKDEPTETYEEFLAHLKADGRL